MLMNHLREEHQVLKVKIPGLRFSLYRAVVIPEEGEWKKSTKELVRLCLEASFRPTPPGDKKERARFYEESRKLIAIQIPNGGSLITNHFMAVLAIVGLVPLWFAGEHTVDVSSKSLAFLVEHKGLVKGKAAADRFLESLSSALQTDYGINANRKYSENVNCKSYRLEKDRIAKEAKTKKESSDKRYSDLHFDKQCIFQVVGGQVHVHRFGYETVVVSGGLIDRWALGGRVWKLSQLLLQFEDTSVERFSIPKQLGKQGTDCIVPNWICDVFPRPFVMSNPNKERAVVQSLLSN